MEKNSHGFTFWKYLHVLLVWSKVSCLSKAKLTCKGAYFPQSHGERELQREQPKNTSLTVYPSSTWAIHIYDERHMELSKEARLWVGTDLALTHTVYRCSGCQLFTFSMTTDISATCPKLSQDDTGKGVGILPHLDNTHRKLASNSQHHAQLWQRPTGKFPFLLLLYQNWLLQRCRIITLEF